MSYISGLGEKITELSEKKMDPKLRSNSVEARPKDGILTNRDVEKSKIKEEFFKTLKAVFSLQTYRRQNESCFKETSKSPYIDLKISVSNKKKAENLYQQGMKLEMGDFVNKVVFKDLDDLKKSMQSVDYFGAMKCYEEAAKLGSKTARDRLIFYGLVKAENKDNPKSLFATEKYEHLWNFWQYNLGKDNTFLTKEKRFMFLRNIVNCPLTNVEWMNYSVGSCYKNGDHLSDHKSNCELAIPYFFKSLSSPDSENDALSSVGECYLEKENPDLEKAFLYFNKRLAKGFNFYACLRCFELLFIGLVEDKKKDFGFSYLSKMEENKSVFNDGELSVFYEKTGLYQINAKNNVKDAKTFFYLAKEKGNKNADIYISDFELLDLFEKEEMAEQDIIDFCERYKNDKIEGYKKHMFQAILYQKLYGQTQDVEHLLKSTKASALYFEVSHFEYAFEHHLRGLSVLYLDSEGAKINYDDILKFVNENKKLFTEHPHWKKVQTHFLATKYEAFFEENATIESQKECIESIEKAMPANVGLQKSMLSHLYDVIYQKTGEIKYLEGAFLWKKKDLKEGVVERTSIAYFRLGELAIDLFLKNKIKEGEFNNVCKLVDENLKTDQERSDFFLRLGLGKIKKKWVVQGIKALRQAADLENQEAKELLDLIESETQSSKPTVNHILDEQKIQVNIPLKNKLDENSNDEKPKLPVLKRKNQSSDQMIKKIEEKIDLENEKKKEISFKPIFKTRKDKIDLLLEKLGEIKGLDQILTVSIQKMDADDFFLVMKSLKLHWEEGKNKFTVKDPNTGEVITAGHIGHPKRTIDPGAIAKIQTYLFEKYNVDML